MKIKAILILIAFPILLIGCTRNAKTAEEIPSASPALMPITVTETPTEEEEVIQVSEKELLSESLPLDEVQNRPYRFFAKPQSSWVGDVMPFYEDGVYNIFFLDDARDGKPQFHPVALATTENLTDYDFKGVVLPYGGLLDQDIAIGTGSVFKAKDGLYHAFYTGHNYNFPNEGKPREAMMHAVSEDMLNWTKIPEDTFTAPKNYEENDFRDPFVIWIEEAQEYWMLITARTKAKGVIARYSSQDLSDWTLEKPLYESEFGITECADLFQFGDKWYLVFSTDWMTYYRISDSPYGPWEKMEYDRFDGRGFYAAKTGGNTEKRILFGWIGTKNPAKDSGKWEWAGNMAATELWQDDKGALWAKLPQTINELFSPHKKEIEELIELEGSKDVAGKVVGTVHDKMLIEADLTFAEGTEWAGFAANFKDNISQGYGLNFNTIKQQMHFVEGRLSMFRAAKSNYVFTPIPLNANEKVHIKILIDRDICVLYYNDILVLSTRMYNQIGGHWGFYAINGGLTAENVTVAILP